MLYGLVWFGLFVIVLGLSLPKTNCERLRFYWVCRLLLQTTKNGEYMSLHMLKMLLEGLLSTLIGFGLVWFGLSNFLWVCPRCVQTVKNANYMSLDVLKMSLEVLLSTLMGFSLVLVWVVFNGSAAAA